MGGLTNDLGADLTYLSLCGGVQSTALLICSALGWHDVPRADVAIWSDVGCEAVWTYQAIDMLREWSPIPIVKVSAGHSMTEHPRLEVPPPVFTRNRDGSVGMANRQCTREYKIRPIEREVRRRMGYRPRQVVKKLAAALIGISWEERQRAKLSSTRWVVNIYPFVEGQLTRDDCRRIIERAGLTVPGKSSCVCCPYHGDDYWRVLKERDPAGWEEACRYDEHIRSQRSIKGGAYLHRSLRPLREIDFGEDTQLSLWDAHPPVCEGMCGL